MKWTEFIEKIKLDFRLSEPEIADLCGVSYTTINKIRIGKTENPRPNTIKALENGLKIKIDNSNPDDISYSVVPTLVRENPNEYEISEIVTEKDLELLRKLKMLGVNTIEDLDQIFDFENLAEDIKDILKKRITNKI